MSSDGSRANALLELAPCSQLPRWMVWLGPRFSSGPRRSSFCENYLLDLSPHSLRQHMDAPLQFPPLALLPHSPLCPATNAAVRTERWGTARPHRPGKAPEARIPIAASLRMARASWASRFGGGEQLCSERRALATSSKGQGPDGGGGHGGQLRRLPSPPGAGRGFAIVFGNFWNIRNTPLDIWIETQSPAEPVSGCEWPGAWPGASPASACEAASALPGTHGARSLPLTGLRHVLLLTWLCV